MSKSPNTLRHIGFIMDGNGRWAKQRNKPRTFGHKKGADTIIKVLTECFNQKVEVVSLYAFSTENWSRPKEEIDEIFKLLRDFLKRYTSKLIEEKIRLVISGDISVIESGLRDECEKLIKQTKNFEEHTLNIAINYGSRAELLRAMNKLKGKDGEITVEDVEKELYTCGLPDIDMVVRTSGEMRLSNFFLWQCAYSEFYFTDVLWPDFDEEQTKKAVEWYYSRKRRFGGI